ncbi:hypothetical protein F2Q69_00026102 [Brassica cretica]|uniref:Uncharacterized protein n=2 Tax=Brassica TaxID=3705 RepID=A0A8S9S062_BRACR|nr:hypothetical protein F2Q69_00026102 [Brassica cretica]
MRTLAIRGREASDDDRVDSSTNSVLMLIILRWSLGELIGVVYHEEEPDLSQWSYVYLSGAIPDVAKFSMKSLIKKHYMRSTESTRGTI